jgi:hypothetical protein
MLYVIQSKGSGRIIIGKTTNVLARLTQLQTDNVDTLEILATIPDTASDCKFHQRFGSDWVRGEWFMPSEALMQFIKALPKSKYDGIFISAGARPEPRQAVSGMEIVTRAVMTGFWNRIAAERGAAYANSN